MSSANYIEWNIAYTKCIDWEIVMCIDSVSELDITLISIDVNVLQRNQNKCFNI